MSGCSFRVFWPQFSKPPGGLGGEDYDICQVPMPITLPKFSARVQGRVFKRCLQFFSSC